MSNNKYQPVSGYVIVAPFMREQESDSGIVLEAEAKANTNTEGVIRALNADGVEFNEGDVVAFATGVSLYEKQVVHDCEQCYILPVDNIIAKVY